MRGRCVAMIVGLLALAACAAPTSAALDGTRPIETTTSSTAETRPTTTSTTAPEPSTGATFTRISGTMITLDAPFGYRNNPSFPTLVCRVRETCGTSFLTVAWFRADLGQEPATRLRTEIERLTDSIGAGIESETEVDGRTALRLDFDINPPTTAYAFTADLYAILLLVRSDPTSSTSFDALRTAAEHAHVGTDIEPIDPGWTYDSSELQLQANGPGWSIVGRTDRASDDFPAMTIGRGCYGTGTTVGDPPDEAQLRSFAEDALGEIGAGVDGGSMTYLDGERVWEAVGPLVKDGTDQRAWSVALLLEDSYVAMTGSYPAARGQQGLADARRLRADVRLTAVLDQGLRCR